MHPGHLVIFILMVVGFGILTFHRDLRDEPDQWWRLGASLPCAYFFAGLVAFTFGAAVSAVIAGFGILATLALAMMWRSHLSFFPARKMENLLYGAGHGGGGFVAEFGHARGLMKDQNWREAVREIEEQLRKDPYNFEGHRLLISCYLDLNQPGRALKVAQSLLPRPELTDEQRDWIKAACVQLAEDAKGGGGSRLSRNDGHNGRS